MTQSEFFARIYRDLRQDIKRHGRRKPIDTGLITTWRDVRPDLQLPREYVLFMLKWDGLTPEVSDTFPEGKMEFARAQDIEQARKAILEDDQEHKEIPASWLQIAKDCTNGDWVLVYDPERNCYYQVDTHTFEPLQEFATLGELLDWVSVEVLEEEEKPPKLGLKKGVKPLRQVWEAEAHAMGITNVVALPGVQTVVSFSAPKARDRDQLPPGDPIKVWDALSGKLQAAIGPEDGGSVVSAISPDGGRLLYSNGIRIACMNVETREVVWSMRCEGLDFGLNTLAISPDGTTLATNQGDLSIRLYRLSDGSELRRLKGKPVKPRVMLFAPDGQHLLIGGGDRRPTLWNVATGERERDLDATRSALISMVLLPDGKQIACGEASGRGVSIWDLQSGTIVREIGQHDAKQKGVTAVAFTPDGQRMITGGADGWIKVWNFDTGKELASAEGSLWHFRESVGGEALSCVRALVALPDGKHVLSGGGDCMLKLWELP